jgi:phage terminase Nu1 subunit (DNA packaging protein)
VSRYELARLMGVSVATVDRMVAEGMPSVTWGRRTRRFRPSVAIGWAAERGRAA